MFIILSQCLNLIFRAQQNCILFIASPTHLFNHADHDWWDQEFACSSFILINVFHRMARRAPRFTSKGITRKFLCILLLILGSITIVAIFSHGQMISYFFRPLWDNPPPDFEHIPHYYAENVSMSHLCGIHGWSLRSEPRRVFDAIIFSHELDLLEIRWNELLPYVDKFVILEANTTFTGMDVNESNQIFNSILETVQIFIFI